MLRISNFVTNPYYEILYIQIISDIDKVFVNLLIAVKRPRLRITIMSSSGVE